MTCITWLHLSDLQFETKGYPTWSENIALRKLLDDIAERMKQDGLRPDFVVVTGDIAHSGKPAEYELARQFFDELLRVTALGKDRLFLIPGNHDVDLGRVSRGAQGIASTLVDRDSTRDILTNPGDRRLMLASLQAYAAFINDYMQDHLQFDDDHYFYVQRMELARRHIAILGLNSVWATTSSQGERTKIVVGEYQVRKALDAAAGADLTIALLHHSFESLRQFDREDVESLLSVVCSCILHGHTAQGGVIQAGTPDTRTIIIAAGTTHEMQLSPNLYNLVRLDLESGIGTIYLRRYSGARGGFWAKDTLTYRSAPDGKYDFEFGNVTAPPSSHLHFPPPSQPRKEDGPATPSKEPRLVLPESTKNLKVERNWRNIPLLVWFLIGSALSAFLVFLLSAQLRCLLEFRITEAQTALLALIVGGLTAATTWLLPSDARKVLISFCSGMALIFVAFILVVWMSSPIPIDECLAPPAQTPNPTYPPTENPTNTPTMPEPSAGPPSTPTQVIVPIPTPECGGRIAFTSDRNSVMEGEEKFDNREIYVICLDGTEPLKRLTNDAIGDFHNDRNPVWSPNGAQIAFVSDRAEDSNDTDIWVMNSDGGEQTNLAGHHDDDKDNDEDNPSWSPDGKHIAFQSNRTGNWDIYVMTTDGALSGNLTEHAAEDVEPSWSPDGTQVAFASKRDDDGDYDIYVMDIHGNNVAALTQNQYQDRWPTWSPDGSKIAFRSCRWELQAPKNGSCNWDIYVMNTDGGDENRLTKHLANEEWPCWSPDGTRIAFTTLREGKKRIYVVNADGTDPERLTSSEQGNWDDWTCSWAPE